MEIHIDQIIFQIINFSIIVLVLYKLVYGPVLKVLEQRSKKIEDGIKAAEKNLKVQGEIEEQKKDALTEARRQATSITKQTKKDAEVQAQEIIAKAKADAKTILDKERKAMEANLDQERMRLEKEFAALVTKTTAELLKKHLTTADQKKIIDAQINDLKSIKLA